MGMGKARQVIMLPDEFLDLISEIRTSMNLTVVLWPLRRTPEIWDGNRKTFGDTDYVYLAEGTVDAESLADKYAPARLGWVRSAVPHIQDDTLFVVQIDTRGGWFDVATGVMLPNKEASKRFDRVWRRFSKRLRFPTVARDIRAGVAASYKGVGYSAGAEDWFRQGRKLRQKGVANLEFLIPDATNA